MLTEKAFVTGSIRYRPYPLLCLGSTAYTVNGTTAPNAHLGETRYFPWGKDRFTSGVTLTSNKFTGQRKEVGVETPG